MNKRTFVQAAVLAVSLLASGVGVAQTKAAAVSYVTAPFNVPSIVMREKGFLDEAFAAEPS